VKIFGDDIDLTLLPIANTAEYDIPTFISAGMNIALDPETEWQNLALSRFQVKGKRKCGQLILAFQQTGAIYNKYVKAGKPMPCVVVIGADPVYTLLTQIPAPPQVDEVDYWGVFTGEPPELVKAETCDILVPATAEIILEGEVDPVERELEGPFSEYTSYYSGLRYLPVFRINAMTMRKDAIYRHMYMASLPNEGHDAACMMFESQMYTQIKALVPEVRDVSVVTSWSNVTAVSIDKKARQRSPGLVRKVGMAAKSIPASGFLKLLIVMDDDMDIRNLQEMMWCFSTKFQPSKDFYVIEGTPGLILDPSEPWQDYPPGMGSYGIIDLTEKPAPYDEPYKRGVAKPPESAIKKVEANWTKYGFK
jgi:UbiD family decarboxylase